MLPGNEILDLCWLKKETAGIKTLYFFSYRKYKDNILSYKEILKIIQEISK